MKIDVAGLRRLTPDLPWDPYFKQLKFESLAAFKVTAPDFFSGLNRLLPGTQPEILRAYLRWQVLHAMTDALARAFRDANEEFYGRVLNGRSGSRPRWRVCVASAARDEGESLGREYVRRLSSAEARRFATGLVEGVERALVATVGQLAWMDDPA